MTDFKEPKAKTKLKKFNLKEEKIAQGWERPRSVGYDPNKFRPLEGLWVGLVTAAAYMIGQAKGFFNIDLEPLFNGTVSPLIVGAAIIIFAEAVFHFMFLYKKFDKPDFWSFTVPYKTISYILGVLCLIITPLATLLGGATIPYLINHWYALWVARRNFNDRAKYYAPEEFDEPTYEEPKEQKGPSKPSLPAHISADIMSSTVMVDSEYLKACDNLVNTLKPVEEDMLVIPLPNIGGFINKYL